MLRNKRLLLVTLALGIASVVVMGMKIAYPYHRLLGFILLGLGWIPLVLSYRINRSLLHPQKDRLKKKVRPFVPHAAVGVILLLAYYIGWTLFPVDKSPLTDLTREELRAEISSDLSSYLMLRQTADDLLREFGENGLLNKSVDQLTREDRETIRSLWRDGVMVFLEFDMLKAKYRGFYQVDYLAQPELHANAFMLAYMVYVAQYNACLLLTELVGDNDFMETLLNEKGEGIPDNGYFSMKVRLTHPSVMLRMNAAAAYYELIRKDVTLDPVIIADFEQRRSSYLHALGEQVDLFIDNPLDVLERAAFETMLPVQKSVAVQMSHIRTARRDYLITPEILAGQMEKLEPGDILIQRRNWHMTNIGIPGFWPHVALYVGTPEEIDQYFADLGFPPSATIQSLYPEASAALNAPSHDGFPKRVIESIRPGVVFQSLETSARCDYLGVIRPNLSKPEKFKALLSAFSHYGKAYDRDGDVTTDDELVCSELVYKAYRAAGDLPLETEVINGRRLLPPNRLAEQAVEHMGGDDAFTFVLFLDALEKDDKVVARGESAFRESWQRPKWDIMQD